MNAAHSSAFTAHERAALAAVARASMPRGKIFPGGGAASAAKVELFMTAAPGSMRKGYRALIWALDAAALARHLRPLDRLSNEQVLALIESWRGGDYARRMMLRLLTAPLKAAHFNDPAMYAEVGCRYGALPVQKEESPRYMRERVVDGSACGGDETFECDVVVIGTGAGGAVAARELAEAGVAVILLEEGAYHHRDEFNGQAVQMQQMLYRDMGATVSVGNVSIPIPVGKSVGGTTTINSGTCYLTPDRVLRKWADLSGCDELLPDALAPFYERVESVLRVTEADARYTGGVARVIARGCDELGYRHRPLRRNAPDCDGQGLCCFGCPTDAKRSTNVSYVPLALKAGAQLFTNVRADQILTESGRAVGVSAFAGKHRIEIRARAVVVACGSLLTPLVLGRSGLGGTSGQLGRNLSIHPAVAAMALFDEVIDAVNAIPQGYAIEEFHEEGLLFEGVFTPLDVGAASLPLHGPKLVEVLEQFKQLACFGVMIEDTSRGRVRAGPGGKPIITYVLNEHDVARLKRGVEIMARVYFAAGATRVLPLVHGFDELIRARDVDRLRAARLTARDFEITAYHPLGTARMGRDPRRSVIGPDHGVHDVPGLYITDGSALPSSPAVNPQMTIMALATRAALKLAARLS
jgi:hypothetical protein